MPRLEWEGWKVNFGHVLTIMTMVVGVAVAWGQVRAEQAAMERRVVAMEARVEKLAGTDEIVRQRQVDIERDMVRGLTRLETLIGAMSTEMVRLGRAIERERGGP
jgi:hypothetical protein